MHGGGFSVKLFSSIHQFILAISIIIIILLLLQIYTKLFILRRKTCQNSCVQKMDQSITELIRQLEISITFRNS